MSKRGGIQEGQRVSDRREGNGRRSFLLAAAGLVMLAASAPAVRRILGDGRPNERTVDDPRALADPDSEFLQIRGLSVHVKRSGDTDPHLGPDPEGRTTRSRPALLLLHGFAASLFTWREVMGPLGERGPVVAYDRPAFGLTSRPREGEWDPRDWPGGSPYGPEAQADLALALVDRLSLKRVVLVGNSMGGALAALIAARHPDRVAALVLEDAAIFRGGPPSWSQTLVDSRLFRYVGPRLTAAATPSFTRGLRRLFHDPSLVGANMIEGYERPMRIRGWETALWELTRAGGLPDLEGPLAALRMPVLVLAGSQDPLITPAQNRRLAALIPGSELEFVDDCGHIPHEERPGEFLRVVNEFLDRRLPAHWEAH